LAAFWGLSILGGVFGLFSFRRFFFVGEVLVEAKHDRFHAGFFLTLAIELF